MKEVYSFIKTEMQSHSFEEPIVSGVGELMFAITMRRPDSYEDS